MSEHPVIIRSKQDLQAQYHSLKAGDIILGRLLLRPSEESKILDLIDRGILFFPSSLAHMASRSKTFQVVLFLDYMFPHTLAIHDRHDLVRATVYYGEHSITQVVTKNDRDDGGRGIHLWNSIEDLYTQASFGVIPYPFVIQPFYQALHDIRVIALGDYLEAYCRYNPHNFRNNICVGGESTPYVLTPDQWSFCQKVMERGQFPHAHLDLRVLESGELYLGEINLYGGILGAHIGLTQYKERTEAIYDEYLKTFN